MNKITFRIGLYFCLAVVLLLICILHIPYIIERPRVPFDLKGHDNSLIIEKIIEKQKSGELITGDTLILWEQQNISTAKSVSFLSENAEIGDKIEISFQRGSVKYITEIQLTAYYSSIRYIIIIIFVGFVTWCMSIFLLLYGPSDLVTRSLYWAMMGLSIATMMTAGRIVQNDYFLYLAEVILYLFYMLCIASFFFFSTVFPKPKPGSISLKLTIVSIPSILLVIFIIYYRLRAIHLQSLEDFLVFQTAYDLFHVILLVLFAGAIFNFIHAYKRIISRIDILKLKWILWGVMIGTIPFLSLSILPDFFLAREIVHEEYTLILFLVIPFSFTIAIFKYHLFNIDSIINRTIVYSILTISIGLIYITTVYLTVSAIGDIEIYDTYFIILMITFIVAIFFDRLRLRIQKFINETFFSARTHYRKAINEIIDEIGKALSSDDLFRRMIQVIQHFVPIENLAIYLFENGKLNLESEFGAASQNHILLSPAKAEKLGRQIKVYAKPSVVSHQSEILDFSELDLLDKLDFAILIPMITESKSLAGALFCNPHAGNKHFIEEEIDLFLTSCKQTSEILGRLLLQENIIVEREEKKRLKELSDLKSYFVSSVSHDLQTPLTSIKMFAELIQANKDTTKTEKDEYINIILGESDRLSRLISNALNVSKIERGVKEYQFAKVELNNLINKVLQIMSYQLKQYGFKIDLKLSNQPIHLSADEDAIIETLTNIIANAIKYSADEKYISLATCSKDNLVTIQIADKGIGISDQDKKNIFKRFFRAQDKKTQTLGGAGLGLTIVKHVIDAHKGEIKVDSSLGKGTVFTILLPKELS